MWVKHEQNSALVQQNDNQSTDSLTHTVMVDRGTSVVPSGNGVPVDAQVQVQVQMQVRGEQPRRCPSEHYGTHIRTAPIGAAEGGGPAVHTWQV